MNAARIDSLARSLGAKRLKVSLPWEEAPLKPFFGREEIVETIPAPDWVELPDSSERSKSSLQSVPVIDRFNAKKHLSEVSWAVSEDAKLNSALQMWKVIVLDSTIHTKLGATLMQCIQNGKDEDFVFQVVADAFAGKSMSTLKSRAASLLAFGRWKRAVNVEKAHGLFPITELAAYEYLCDLRRNKAASSKRTRFLQAVGFAKGLLGADVDAVLSSARVKGAAFNTAFTDVRKKEPLTVQQLIFLERLAMDHPGPEGIFAGYICFLVHCRLRWSDGQHCVEEPWVDVFHGRGFLEARLYHHKTAKKLRTQAGRLLPVAGVLPGLSGELWAIQWLDHRCKLGLTSSKSCPTMPAPVAVGGWTKHPLTSSEASVWLRELLAPCSPQLLKDIATHSCKTTILSWMSKANTPLSIRRLAGYHVKPGDKSALEYSRDAAAPILRQIEGIMIAIRSGQFCPDEARSMRWVGCESIEEAVMLAANAVSVQDGGDEFEVIGCDLQSGDSESAFEGMEEVNEPDEMFSEGLDGHQDHLEISGSKPQPCLDDIPDETPLISLVSQKTGTASAFPSRSDVEPWNTDFSDMSASSSTFSDSDSGASEADRRCEIDGRINASDLVLPSDLAGKRCFQHVKSGKFHFVGRSVNNDEFLRCGRRVTKNYCFVSTAPAFTIHGCQICFGFGERSERPEHESD